MVSTILFAGIAITPSSIPFTFTATVMEISKSVAVIFRTFLATSKRRFSRIGSVDRVGTTPMVLERAFCNSLLVTENFMDISLKGCCGVVSFYTEIYQINGRYSRKERLGELLFIGRIVGKCESIVITSSIYSRRSTRHF